MWNLPFRKTLKNPESYSGQALLIILLVMSVALTTVLSVVSRSVTDISITTYESDSVRALSAAEAGIEQVFITKSSTGEVTLDNDAKFDAQVATATPVGDEFAYPTRLNAGEAATFWFVSHDATSRLTCAGEPCFQGPRLNVYWGDGLVTGPNPAIEISIYYDTTYDAIAIGSNDFNNVEVIRLAYDPDSRGNNFSSAVLGTFNIGGETYDYSTGDIILTSLLPPGCPEDLDPTHGCVLMVSVKALYNTTDVPLGIITTTSGSGKLPAQGINISSTGEFGDSVRKVNVFQSYSVPPVIFESSIFSYGKIVK